MHKLTDFLHKYRSLCHQKFIFDLNSETKMRVFILIFWVGGAVIEFVTPPHYL